MDRRYPRSYRYPRVYSNKRPEESFSSFKDGDKKEIATKVVFLEGKKFYIDLIKSLHGKLLKITEVSMAGQKFKLVMRLETAMDIVELLGEFADYASKLDIKKLDARPLPIKTSRLFSENRKYYIDLLNYPSGLFLKVAAKSSSRENAQILIPGHCIGSFIDTMHEVMGTDRTRHKVESSSSKMSTEVEATAGVERQGMQQDDDEGCGRVYYKRNNSSTDVQENKTHNLNNNSNTSDLGWDGGRLILDKYSSPHYLTITQEVDGECSNIRVPVELGKRFAEEVLGWVSLLGR